MRWFTKVETGIEKREKELYEQEKQQRQKELKKLKEEFNLYEEAMLFNVKVTIMEIGIPETTFAIDPWIPIKIIKPKIGVQWFNKIDELQTSILNYPETKLLKKLD